jgi:hypothetical protein
VSRSTPGKARGVTLPSMSMRARTLDVRELGAAGALAVGTVVLLPLVPGYDGVTCFLRTLTGVPCPLCGMSTSVQATVRGDFAGAVAANPAGPVLVALVVAALMARAPVVRVHPTVPYAALLAAWIYQLGRFDVL